MASINSTVQPSHQPSMYASHAERRPTADELRALPDELLERLYDVAVVVSDCEKDDFGWDAICLIDDIDEAANIPMVYAQYTGQPRF